eukprot:768657-Hanusia_phi.AAC.7
MASVMVYNKKIKDAFEKVSKNKQMDIEKARQKKIEHMEKMLEIMEINPKKRKHQVDDATHEKRSKVT